MESEEAASCSLISCSSIDQQLISLAAIWKKTIRLRYFFQILVLLPCKFIPKKIVLIVLNWIRNFIYSTHEKPVQALGINSHTVSNLILIFIN